MCVFVRVRPEVNKIKQYPRVKIILLNSGQWETQTFFKLHPNPACSKYARMHYAPGLCSLKKFNSTVQLATKLARFLLIVRKVKSNLFHYHTSVFL